MTPARTAAAASDRLLPRRCRRRPGPGDGRPGPAYSWPGPGAGDTAGDPHGGRSGGAGRACPAPVTVGGAPAIAGALVVTGALVTAAVSMLNARVTGSGSQPVAG